MHNELADAVGGVDVGVEDVVDNEAVDKIEVVVEDKMEDEMGELEYKEEDDSVDEVGDGVDIDDVNDCPLNRGFFLICS